jgi:dodecin
MPARHWSVVVGSPFAGLVVNTARKSLRDLRIAEVVDLDLSIGDGGEITYRTKLRLSFKYESE